MSQIQKTFRILSRSMVAGLVALLLVAPASAYELQRTFDSDDLTLHNLVGEVQIEQGGSQFEVIVQVRGSGATKGAIRLEASGDELQILFPDDVSDLVYPAMGRGSNTKISLGDSDWLPGMSSRKRIRISGSGSGLELWADVTVRVPNGAHLQVKHGVGKVIADSVEAELELATRSGDVHAERTYGPLAVATGSGDVELRQVNGDEVQVATGSGDVTVDTVDGDEMEIATGSGDIELRTFRGRELQAATGSGDIGVREVGADEVEIGTGSGDVTLTLDRMGMGEFSIGTGSGDIEMSMPGGASAEIHAETDRGEIRLDLGGPVKFRTQKPDEVELTVGDGGARVQLGSGSGDIRIAG